MNRLQFWVSTTRCPSTRLRVAPQKFQLPHLLQFNGKETIWVPVLGHSCNLRPTGGAGHQNLIPTKRLNVLKVSCGRAAVAMTTAILDEPFSSGASDGDVAVQPRGDKLGLIGSTQENFCFFFC